MSPKFWPTRFLYCHATLDPYSFFRSQVDMTLIKNKKIYILFRFVCLFVGFTSHSRFFSSHGDVTITGKVFQNLTLYHGTTVSIIQYIFLCLEFIVTLENFLLIWRRQYCRWRAANSNLCAALMAIE